MVNNLKESQLIKIWQHQLLARTKLATEEGEPIAIIYPGRLNDDAGADFREAVVATNRGLVYGDIEIHVKSSDWRGHGHHRDAVYNRVILHVVMWHNTKVATKLENGGEVPTLALEKYVRTPISQWLNWRCAQPALNMPCHHVAQRLSRDRLTEWLDRAGEERFSAKVGQFQMDLTQMEAGQSLYQGIMGALGYSKNKLPFIELASRVPLPVLESLTRGEISEEECLVRPQALLLGTAGLLPSQRSARYELSGLEDKWVDRLERLWAAVGYPPAMSANTWHLFKVRPNNSPLRRLVAMSYLIVRYREKGILAELVSQVREAPLSRGYHWLEAGLLVTTDGYWADHFDFGSGCRLSSPTLLGRGRAADIIVNVLLPFTFAWSQFTAQPELGRQALALYRGYPKLAVNSVERQMRHQLGLSSHLVSSARQQQGLIHIYKSRCTQGRCNSCPLS